MVTVENIDNYISDNILHSESWDELDTDKKQKALNNAIRTLKEYIPSIFASDEVSLFDVAEQVLFVIRKDDNMMKAEMGLKGMGVDGITMSYDNISPIAPSLMTKYGLTVETLASARRRRVGSYAVSKHDTFRSWGCGCGTYSCKDRHFHF